MRLVIDIGNTRAKIGVFSSKTMVFLESFNKLSLDDIKVIIDRFPSIDKSIFSSVSDKENKKKEIQDYLNSKTNLVNMSQDLFFSIHSHYLSPKTLGKDRLAGVIGAKALFEEDNYLVIDAGTCITIDFIDKENNYFGGSISPGINMKYKSLNTFTDSLPLLSHKYQKEDMLGVDTQSSIMSGVVNGTIMELKGFINYYSSIYLDLKILFTGGDGKFLQTYFKENTILEEHLVLLGLNIILDTNA